MERKLLIASSFSFLLATGVGWPRILMSISHAYTHIHTHAHTCLAWSGENSGGCCCYCCCCLLLCLCGGVRALTPPPPYIQNIVHIHHPQSDMDLSTHPHTHTHTHTHTHYNSVAMGRRPARCYRFHQKKPYIKSRYCRGVPGMYRVYVCVCVYRCMYVPL